MKQGGRGARRAALLIGLALLLLGLPPDRSQPAVPLALRAHLLSACRDALRDRLDLDLDPAVGPLPDVQDRGNARFHLMATAIAADGKDGFSCEAVHRDGRFEVTAVERR